MAKNNNVYAASGSAFMGCIILGVGIGLLFEQAGAGAVIGTGLGFLVMSVMRSLSSK